MNSEVFTAYITKYALSGGILKKEVKLEHNTGSMVVALDNGYSFYHGEGREWHRTKESAVARAEEMRVAKIASLKKQIAKLEKLSFSEASE